LALETFGDEKGLVATPDELGHALLTEEAWSANVAEAIVSPLGQGDEAITLEYEVSSEFSGW